MFDRWLGLAPKCVLSISRSNLWLRGAARDKCYDKCQGYQAKVTHVAIVTMPDWGT